MRLGLAHTCAHTNAFKGKFRRIHPPGFRHLHQPGVGVNHPKWLILMSLLEETSERENLRRGAL